MIAEHHYQKVDLENGYIEAARDDTNELQDLRVKVYLPDSTLIRELRILYNIQYDYCRWQEWLNGVMVDDDIIPHHAYGHLQWEFSLQSPPGDWVNPYPDNYEPVKPEGADMFHRKGLTFRLTFVENKVTIHVNFYIWDGLEEIRKPNMNLITDVEPITPSRQWFFDDIEKEEKERLRKSFNPQLARDKRLINLGKQCKEIGVDIPIDPRFID